MTRFWKAALIALLGVILVVPGGLLRAAERTRNFQTVDHDDDDGGSFYIYNPGFYPGYGWGWYNPWWGPDWGWGFGWNLGPRRYLSRPTGKIKIETSRKHAAIYVDGGYAGVSGKTRQLRLRPGNHMIQLRNAQGHIFFQEKVHVMRGKTVTLDANTPNLPPQHQSLNGHTGPPPAAPQGPEHPGA